MRRSRSLTIGSSMYGRSPLSNSQLKTLQRTWLLCCGAGVGLVALTDRPALSEEPTEPEKGVLVVATVNGDAITYGEFKISSEEASRRFELLEKHAPETAADRDDVRRLRHNMEAEQLKIHILVAIRRQVRSELQIHVSEEEASDYLAKKISEDPNRTIPEAIRAGQVQLLDALEAVYVDGMNPDDVYQRKIANIMPKKAWEWNLEYFKTPERRKILAMKIEKPDETITDELRNGVRRGLLMLKTNEAIARLLEATDPELIEYRRLQKTDPHNEKLRKKPPNLIVAKRHEWWQKRFRDAQVEILDDHFKDVWKEPFE